MSPSSNIDKLKTKGLVLEKTILDMKSALWSLETWGSTTNGAFIAFLIGLLLFLLSICHQLREF
jgi:hypothetical protein